MFFYGNISCGDSGHFDRDDFGNESGGGGNGTAVVHMCGGDGSDFQLVESADGANAGVVLFGIRHSGGRSACQYGAVQPIRSRGGIDYAGVVAQHFGNRAARTHCEEIERGIEVIDIQSPEIC